MWIRSQFDVTEPASDLALLTTDEAKTALGITDNSRDADIDRMVLRASASIYRACKVREDGINPPTFLSEGITETFRLEDSKPDGKLMLSRRWVTEVTTVTEGGTELVEDESYYVDRASGMLVRLGAGSLDEVSYWCQGKVVVEYVAGFTEVPEDLKLAAESWIRVMWRDAYASPGTITDSTLRVEDIPGVRRIERFPNLQGSQTMIPPDVVSMLMGGGYLERWIG